MSLSLPVGPNLIRNGGFESAKCSRGADWCIRNDNRTIAPWYMAMGSKEYEVDLSVWKAAEGAVSMDLSGNGPNAIAQDITTIPGRKYCVMFQLTQNTCGVQNKTGMVGVTGAKPYNFWYQSPQKSGWVTEMFEFVATSAKTTVTFCSTTQDSCGPVIDDVQVVELLPFVPLKKNLVQNGGFEDKNPSCGVDTCCVKRDITTIAPWYFAKGTNRYEMDLTPGNAAEGKVSIHLGRQGTTALSQDVCTVPGYKYCIAFKVNQQAGAPAGNYTGCVEVSGQKKPFMFNASKQGWTDVMFDFTATSTSTTLTFASMTNADCGPVIDDIELMLLVQEDAV